jgi:CRP-like cAMP-binding protein
MGAPLILRVQTCPDLTDDDRAVLDRLSRGPVREAGPRRDMVREGEEPKVVRLLLDGWACRYKGLPDGRRQIVGFFVPGDFCDLNGQVLRQMDHAVGSITRVRYASIDREEIERVGRASPRIAQALWWNELVNASVEREWLLNVGQRNAYERIAHLLTELYFRLRGVGLTRNGSCDLPLTQNDIAEAAGLTPVHVNRTLQELRRDGLVELAHKRLHIPDLEALMRASMFNTNYLHMRDDGRQLAANG